MSDEIKKPREWWIGRTESGFDKWLTPKHPDEAECRNDFICSDPSEKCVEYIPVVELSALEAAQDMRDKLQHELKMLLRTSQARETELLNLVREMREALAFYAEGRHYEMPTMKNALLEPEVTEKGDIAEDAIAKADATLKRLGVTE